MAVPICPAIVLNKRKSPSEKASGSELSALMTPITFSLEYKGTVIVD